MSDTIPDTVSTVPTLYEWAGGLPALEHLTTHFYARVPGDPLLAPIFAGMSPDHPHHVALFIAEVLGGPKTYSQEIGSHAGMVRHHLARSITEVHRKRWLQMMLESADAIGLPDDPEFRAAFVGYLEWGSRLAVLNSQPGVPDPPSDTPMPQWNWGPPGGPYQPENTSK